MPDFFLKYSTDPRPILRTIFSPPFCPPSLSQVLEGFPDVVGPLFQTICNDKRFGRVTLLEDVRVHERQYPTWSLRILEQELVPPMIPLKLVKSP